MLPTQVLLVLFSFTLANGFKIQIDMGDESPAEHRGQITLEDDDKTSNSSINPLIATDGNEVGPFACPGACPGIATCPSGDKGLRVASDGQPFAVYCGFVTGVNNNQIKIPNIPTFEACVEECAKVPWCVASEYSRVSKRCDLSRVAKTPVGNSNYDGAVKLNVKLPVLAACPGDDGKTVRSLNREYKIYCDYDTPKIPKIQTSTQYSFEECVHRCDEDPGCNHATKSGDTCTTKGTLVTPGKDSNSEKKKGVVVLVPTSGIIRKEKCCPAKS